MSEPKIKLIKVSATAKPSFETRVQVIKHNLKTLPTTTANIHFIWNLLQSLKKEIIDEFQQLVGISMFDFFINFQNGSTVYLKEFKVFVKQITTINKIKQQLNKKISRGQKCQK